MSNYPANLISSTQRSPAVAQGIFDRKQQLQANGSSLWPTAIGSPYGGGYFAGQMYYGTDLYNLVISPRAYGQENTRISWDSALGYGVSGPSSLDGDINTRTNVNFNVTVMYHQATQWVKSLSIGGYTDWYVPAIYESMILFKYFKAQTTNNSITQTVYNTGNPYANPSISAFTTTVPSQTPLTAFQNGNSEYMTSGNQTWTSTDASVFNPSATINQMFTFVSGYWNGGTVSKSGICFVRVIRKVKVNL